MTSTQVPYLTLGILFNLVLQASKDKTSARDKIGGKKDNITDLNIFRIIMEIITGTEDFQHFDTYKKNVSNFKTCTINSSTYIPLESPTIIESFNSRCLSKDAQLLRTTHLFIEEYLESNRLKWLVCSLIDTVISDMSIDNGTIFETALNEHTKKEQLKQVTHVQIEIFLLSVIQYVISNHPDNTNGRETFLAWHKQTSSRSPWKFIKTGLGSDFINKIEFSRITENIPNQENTTTTDSDIPYAEPEIIEPDSSSNKSVTQILNNPKVVIQNATNIYNIGHVEHLD